MYDSFSRNFSLVIELLNLSPKDISESIGVSSQTVLAWMQETKLPSLAHLISFCKTYNVSIDYLLGLTNEDTIHQRVDFLISDPIYKRLRELSPRALFLIYDLIRYVSVADENPRLIDSVFLESVKDKGNEVSPGLLDDLTDDQRKAINTAIASFRAANTAAASREDA